MGEVELPYWLKTLPQAPEYHPTEAEFADPVAYILKIEEEAKQYGICKIVPPFTKASKKVVVNNLNRSLALSTEALPSTVHGACAPMSRSMGGVMLGAELAKPKGLFLDPSCTDSSNKSKFATRRQQLGWNPKRARGVAHSQNHKLVWQSGESYTLEQFEQKAKMFARSRLGTGKDVSPLTVESLFWRAAAEKPISIEYANDIPGSAFADPARLRKRKRGPEEAEQVNLESIFVGCQSEEKAQEEEAGEELDPSDAGKSRNGASETGGDNVGGAGSKLANSAWNMRSVARSQCSLLRFMPEEVPGVTSPMVYIGMLFSWFAWHVEDHELHSLNYLHMGASKTWYAVPGDAAPALEEAIRVHGYGGHLDQRAAFSLLGEKTTVMSPEVLVAAGVPCCRLVQNAGEYVVTFPRAYHLGFSHGFNCGEAANFATPGWLEVAKEAAARRAAMNYLPMLSHQQLLYLLAMSLPPRMPTSAPSEPRSSRLKVRKKSAGEEMVKSMFLQDAVHNNGLLRTLLDNGVSRCLLAKDAGHRSPSKAMSDGSKHRSPLPPLDDLERALISELTSQASEASPFPCPGTCNAEETIHKHCQSLSPSCTPDPSEGHDAVLGDLSMGNFGDIKPCRQSTDPSAEFIKSPIGEAPQELDGNPIPPNNHKETTSLAIDWGTLPCAACGILCYATMAVVEPSEAAAMTFKPIYAAAGLGHRAFEAHEAGRMEKYIPTFPYPRSIPGQDVSDELYRSSLQNTYADGRMKHDVQPGILLELPPPNQMQPVAGDVVSTKHALSAEHGYHFQQLTTQPPEGVEGSKTICPTAHYDKKATYLGHLTLQSANMSLETEMKSGMVSALVTREQTPLRTNYSTDCIMTQPELLYQEDLGVRHGVAMDCASNLVPATLDAARFRSGNLDNYTAYRDWKDSHRTTYRTNPQSEPLAPLARYQSTESKNISCVRIDGSPDAAEFCSEQRQEQRVLLQKQQVVSSLQLLASTYDESSDLEDEDMCQAPEGCDALPEDESSADEAAEGSEVLAKPHSAIGDLLTDVVGVSADVPWLSLVPPTEPTDVPPLLSKTPLFSLASLLEGPKSLKKVFVSGGFSFIEEDDTAGPASLGSSVTEERCGKQSSEVTSVDGDPNNQTSDVHCGDNGKVIDMQELYQRINSQALTVDSDDDEQLMIDFGLRRSRTTCLQESPDLEEPKNDGTERAPSPHQLEVKHPQVDKDLNVISNVPSHLSFALDNSSCPVPNNLETLAKTPSKEIDASLATARTNETDSVGKLLQDSPVGGRISTTSVQAGTQWKDQIPGTVPHLSYERRPPASEACQSARPRVLCLEHAVQAQERLRSVGGATILIVCHADFNDYEVRAKQLTPELGVEHSWRQIPFTEETNDEVRMVSAAVDVDDDSRRVNDWVMQMGLFVHHRFKERESESSDDADENPSEDFRAGPFSRVNQGKPSKNRLMAARLGLSRKSEGPRRLHAGSGAQITLRYSRRPPKMSKKKKCTIAGKWCGKVWRVNQVHPFLGGCRTVDPSLQLGMPSTSLYALSMMADCDGGRHRRGMSSSKIEASPNLILDKNADDQQNIAGRNRVRKRKALEQGMGCEQDNVNGSRRKMAAMLKSSPNNALAVYTTGMESVDCSSSPKRRLLAESREGSECLDDTGNGGGEERFTAGECEGQLMIQVPPNISNQSDADHALLSSKSNITSPGGTQMLGPVPLATRNPSEVEEMINELNGNEQAIGNECGAIDKHLPAVTHVGENECCGSIDVMKTVACAPMSLPSDLALVTGVNALEFQLAPSTTETGRTGEDVDGWHKTSSLSNVYSALPLTGRVVKCRNESNNSLAAKSSPIDGNRIRGTGSAESYVWRDVPLVSAPSFHLTAPRTGEFTNQFPLPLPSSIHSHLYIPYVTVSSKDAVSDHTLAPQTSSSELYSLPSKTFGSCEQGGGNLQGQSVGQALEGGAAEVDKGSFPKVSSSSSPGAPGLTDFDKSVQHFGSYKLMGVNGKQDPQKKPVYLRDEVFSSMEAVVPSVLDRVVGKYSGPNEEDCHGRSCETSNLPQGISEQQESEIGGLQQSLQDIKNVVRLSDDGQRFTTEEAERLASADHIRAQHTNVGQNTSNDSDQVNLQDSHRRNFHLYDSKQAVELTPTLSISPSLIGEGSLVGSGDLGFADAMEQGNALEHPLAILPLRTSSRGRSAVKARGKRPKHVGWTNYKPAVSGTPGEASENNWALQPHSPFSAPVIFTLQPKECVEARFEVEDCERVLEIPGQSTGATCPASSSGLNQVTAEEGDSDEENSEPEKVAVKPKKKAKPKKKRVPVGKLTTDDGDFHCDIDGCRMSFPTDSDLQIHKRNRCTFKGCGKRFFMHKYLLQHRRVHLDERPLKCPWKGCKQAFKWAWARTEHIRVHTGERPYSCPDCEQTFRFVSDFSRHKRNTGHTKS